MAKLVHAKSRKPANDLEVLYPDRRLGIGGSVWTVREYGLIETAQVAPFGERVAQALADGKRPPADVMCHLLGVATGHDIVEIAGLPEAEFASLSRAWMDLNLHMFREQEEEPKGAQSVRWSDLFTTLIAHGHRLDDIGKYTARQVRLLFEAVVRGDAKQRASHIGDMTYGFSGGKATKERIRELNQI